MERLKQLHFWVGLIGIVIFLLTGQYMYHALNVLQGMDDGPRMLFRSAHIYFMLASLINLLVGIYLEPRSLKHGKGFQLTISVLILVAPILLLSGFFLEPYLSDLARPYSKLGLYALFAVAVLMLLVEIKIRVIKFIKP